MTRTSDFSAFGGAASLFLVSLLLPPCSLLRYLCLATVGEQSRAKQRRADSRHHTKHASLQTDKKGEEQKGEGGTVLQGERGAGFQGLNHRGSRSSRLSRVPQARVPLWVLGRRPGPLLSRTPCQC